MQLSSRLPSFVPAAVVSSMLLLPSSALAHIDLIEPNARAHGTAASGDMMIDTNTNQKTGPCGQVTNMRTTDRVTTYAPGQMITVRVREETPHESYIRVSIDLDGDDGFPTRPTTTAETQEVAQAAEEMLDTEGTLLAVVREMNGTPNFVHEITVTLPDETCDNCTLQVIQFMYGASNPYYYQCADIVIAEGGAGGETGMGGGAGAAGMGASGAAGMGMPNGQAGTLAGNTDGYPEDASCSIGSVRASRRTYQALVAVLGLGLAGFARRRSSARLQTH